MILIFRQFQSGDLIEAAGVVGEVEAIDLFSTQLRTADNKTIFIPNGKLLNDNIVNYSRKGTRRLDLEIRVGYRKRPEPGAGGPSGSARRISAGAQGA